MKTEIGASVHVDPSEIRHSMMSGGHGTLCFGPWPTVRRLDLFFDDTASVDAVIAELVALRAEMTGGDPARRLTAKDVAATEPARDDAPAGSGEPGSHHAPGPDEGSEVAWRVDETAGTCRCGRKPGDHHLNQVAGELQYCTACPGVDDCAAYEPATAVTT